MNYFLMGTKFLIFMKSFPTGKALKWFLDPIVLPLLMIKQCHWVIKSLALTWR